MKQDIDDRLPSIPLPTAEQQAAIDEEQSKRAKLINVTSTDSQRAFARANAEIASLTEYGIENLHPTALKEYAQALTVVGRYREAAEILQDATLLDIADALDGRTTLCGCPDTTEVTIVNGQPVTKVHSRLFTRKKVYSTASGTWRNLMMCNVCTNLTVE